MSTTVLMTAEELAELEDDGFRYELIAGELIRMPPAKPIHSRIASNFAYYLRAYIEPIELGIVLESSAGYQFEEGPDTVLAPDVSYIGRDRLTSNADWTQYFRTIPHIAFEVRSPSERRGLIQRRIQIFFDKGVLLVIYAEPENRHLILYEPNRSPRTLTEDDVLTFEDIVPGFQLPVAALFALPAWLQRPQQRDE